MKLRRKITLFFALAILSVCLIAGLLTLRTARAYTDGVAISSNADNTFIAEEKSFEKEASFVFSATVNFNSGNEAGLTFGETEDNMLAFAVDRSSNTVKLRLFTKTDGGWQADKNNVREEFFIGNGKMTDAEKSMVEPKVKTVPSIDLKIVICAEEETAYLECYADGIRRFAFTDGSAPASEIDINSLKEGLHYDGGKIGYYAGKADVNFTDAAYADYDYNYYTELYRNQFHYSQYAHWNNDPNGLVYYNGYYHLFYQHYPFDKVWGDMYWGHARSTDLIHWENLPICLYPERGGLNGSFGDGDGYMWSGSARIYRKGESDVIDNENWFNNNTSLNAGDAAGLIAFYTRDGAKQDQMIMSSDDGGLSWTKRRYIPSCDILGLKPDEKGVKADCRDPKVFAFDDNGTTVYGMLLTGMKDPFNVWFLKSYNLVDWSAAGGFNAKVPLVNTDATNGPECPDIAFFDLDEKRVAVITLAGRGYIAGELEFKDGKFIFKVEGRDISKLPYTEVPVKQMDFGPDSYATQTFCIEDGEYADKIISLSWFSGVPGASASVDSGLLTDLRSRWNCGMTIPVVWGLQPDNDGYVLTQTPIIKDKNINKNVLASVKNYAVRAGENVLENITAATFEIDAEINNPSGGAVAFKVRVGENEYTEIGWNETDGYYVDRTHTASGNLILPNYSAKYAAKTADKENLSFYILVDSATLEVFCGGGKYAFYTVTFPSPASLNMSFVSESDVVFGKLKVNEISSVWRDYDVKSSLAVGKDNVELDLTLSPVKDVTVSGTGEITYEIQEGDGVVSYMKTADGIRLFAEKAGSAVIKAECGDRAEYIGVTVYGGEADADLTFDKVRAGDWYLSDGGYKGYIKAGDAVILSEREGKDFIYSAKFDLNSGVAAALVFRSNDDKSRYIMANYDHGAGLCKLWSDADPVFETEEERKAEYNRRNVPVRLDDLSDVTLTVIAEGQRIRVFLNQRQMIDYTYTNAPSGGKFGLNVCAADVLFKTVSLTDLNNEAYTEGEISWNHTDNSVFTVTNLNLNNKLVDSGFYTVDERKVTLSQNYMASLPEAGVYTLEVRGRKCLYYVDINVGEIPSAVWKDIKLQENTNAVFFIGNESADSVTVNGKPLEKSLYKVEGTQLTVYAKAFSAGENEVAYSDNLRAKVTVEGVSALKPHFNVSNTGTVYTVLFIIVGVILVAEGAFIAFIIFKKDKKENTEDGSND